MIATFQGVFSLALPGHSPVRGQVHPQRRISVEFFVLKKAVPWGVLHPCSQSQYYNGS